MLEFATGLAVGLVCAGAAGFAAHRSIRRERDRVAADLQTVSSDAERTRERLFRLLAANQSEAVRAAIGADPPEAVARKIEEDKRFKQSFCTSD